MLMWQVNCHMVHNWVLHMQQHICVVSERGPHKYADACVKPICAPYGNVLATTALLCSVVRQANVDLVDFVSCLPLTVELNGRQAHLTVHFASCLL